MTIKNAQKIKEIERKNHPGRILSQIPSVIAHIKSA